MYLGLIAQIDATAIWSICSLAERPPHPSVGARPTKGDCDPQRGFAFNSTLEKDHPGPREMPSPAFIE